MLNLEPTPLDQTYLVELADGKKIESSHVYSGCLLELFGHVFPINLMPIALGSFDVHVGMDWLFEVRAEVIGFDKIVCIPLPDSETLLLVGEKSEVPLSIISFVKAKKYLRKGYFAIIAFVS